MRAKTRRRKRTPPRPSSTPEAKMLLPTRRYPRTLDRRSPTQEPTRRSPSWTAESTADLSTRAAPSTRAPTRAYRSSAMRACAVRSFRAESRGTAARAPTIRDARWIRVQSAGMGFPFPASRVPPKDRTGTAAGRTRTTACTRHAARRCGPTASKTSGGAARRDEAGHVLRCARSRLAAVKAEEATRRSTFTERARSR